MINRILLTRIVIILYLLAASQADLFAQLGQIRFVLRDKYSKEPLKGVSIKSRSGEFAGISDSLGLCFADKSVLRPGDTIDLSFIGYQPYQLKIERKKYQYTVDFQKDIVTLAEVVFVNSAALNTVRDIQMSTQLVTAAEARLLPSILGEVDIIKVFQLKPGIKNAGEGMAGFYVRGGGADQNLIMIDNAPVYNPNHLLGLFSVFNIDAVKDVKLYKGAYPANYSGRLSSVIDVRMRPGSMDSLHVSGGMGLLSSRVNLEAPIIKDKASFIISGRRTYFDLFTDMINRSSRDNPKFEPIPSYYFSDLNIRSDYKINNRNRLWATFYLGSDHFSSPPQKSSSSTLFSWGNRTAAINWKHDLSPEVDITTSVYNTNYQYELTNQFDENKYALQSQVNSTGLKVVAASNNANGLSWQTGFDGVMHRLRIGDFNSTTATTGYTSGEIVNGNEAGIFINTQFESKTGFGLLAGARLSGFLSNSKLHVNPEPRFAARYDLNDNTSLKASYTRMYQYLHLASVNSASMPTDMWYPSTERTKPQYADQISAGLATTFNRHRYLLSVEAYYKEMRNQVEFRDGADVFGNPKLENDFIYGSGQAYGLEVYTEKKYGKTTGWIGYTLSWANRRFDEINNGKAFRPRYDRRHDFSVVVMHKINKRLSLSGSWIYGSGAWVTIPVGRFVFQDQVGRQPRTITPIYAQRGNYQLNPVHRLDLNLVVNLKTKRGVQDITFSLYNAYSRRNPLYIQFQESNSSEGYVLAIQPTVVSLFPVLPGITYNFKF